MGELSELGDLQGFLLSCSNLQENHPCMGRQAKATHHGRIPSDGKENGKIKELDILTNPVLQQGWSVLGLAQSLALCNFLQLVSHSTYITSP